MTGTMEGFSQREISKDSNPKENRNPLEGAWNKLKSLLPKNQKALPPNQRNRPNYNGLKGLASLSLLTLTTFAGVNTLFTSSVGASGIPATPGVENVSNQKELSPAEKDKIGGEIFSAIEAAAPGMEKQVYSIIIKYTVDSETQIGRTVIVIRLKDAGGDIVCDPLSDTGAAGGLNTPYVNLFGKDINNVKSFVFNNRAMIQFGGSINLAN